MLSRSSVGLLVAVWLVCPCRADAALFYDLVLRGDGLDSATTSVFGANPGQSFANVGVYLVETTTDSTPSILAQENLNGYAVRLTTSGSDGFYSSITTDPTGGSVLPSADSMQYVAISLLGQPGRSSSGANPREAFLGSVQITAPTTGTTSFRLEDFSIGDGDFATETVAAQGLELAARSSGGAFRNGELTITAVPEPTTIFAMSLAALSAAGVRRLRLGRRS